MLNVINTMIICRAYIKQKHWILLVCVSVFISYKKPEIYKRWFNKSFCSPHFLLGVPTETGVWDHIFVTFFALPPNPAPMSWSQNSFLWSKHCFCSQFKKNKEDSSRSICSVKKLKALVYCIGVFLSGLLHSV